MNRYALKIEYDGTPFHGWQKQSGLETVQGAINVALKKLDPYCSGVTGSGRTDAGVHAIGQVGHLDLKKNWDSSQLQQALNFHLRPNAICIVACKKVNSNFHARFSAIKRHYIFKIINRRPPLALEENRCWHIRHPLDLEKMKQGASYLIGKHDFTTFRSTLCQAKSPIKTLDKIEIKEVNSLTGPSVIVKFEAQSFLHNQIRSIIGTLEKVGSSSWLPRRVELALVSKSRAACGPVAPPSGLYLTKIDYEENIFDMAN